MHNKTDTVRRIGESLVAAGKTLAVMESCTGGLLATTISGTPGCGDYFLGGIVSYATETKMRFGVDEAVVKVHGVVSAETAREMARVAVREFEASAGVGVTGVAGPKTQDGMPVGCVFIAVASGGKAEARRFDFGEDKTPEEIKSRAVEEALGLLEDATRRLAA